MLSELSQDFDEILKTHNGKTSLEYKYDGARVQIHKDREHIRKTTGLIASAAGKQPQGWPLLVEKGWEL